MFFFFFLFFSNTFVSQIYEGKAGSSSFLGSLSILTLLTLTLRPALPKTFQWAFIKLCEVNTWNQAVTSRGNLPERIHRLKACWLLCPLTPMAVSLALSGVSHSVVCLTPPSGFQIGPRWHLFVICSSSFYSAPVVSCFWAPAFTSSYAAACQWATATTASSSVV